MSVNAITENGGEVKFSKDKIAVLKNNQKVLEGNKQCGQLFAANLHKNNIPEEIFLHKEESVKDFCKTCINAKQIRLPFSTVTPRNNSQGRLWTNRSKNMRW